METQLTKVQKNEVVTSDYKQIATDYLRGMGMNLPAKYANQFIDVCSVYKLNPIKRECYAVGYGDNWNIITGYEVYIKRAERTGKLNGWECKIDGDGDNMRAILTINRKDWEKPFVHEVYYTEVVQKKRDGSVNAMWSKMPRFMTKKVAIAQGFRLCFADELGGMPYTSDEVPETEKDITPDVTVNFNNKTIAKIEEETIVYEVADDFHEKLNELFHTYMNVLSQDAKDKICFALANKESEEEMYNRTISYLRNKGFAV